MIGGGDLQEEQNVADVVKRPTPPPRRPWRRRPLYLSDYVC